LLRGVYQVKSATHGVKCLQIAQSEPQPDLILLDIMMSDMDGYEVCTRLKQDKARLLEKMHMTSIAELTRYAMDNQLFD